MPGSKIKRLTLPYLKVFFSILLSASFCAFPFGYFAQAENSDFTVATSTANVTEGVNSQTLDISESVANVSIGEDTQTNTVGTTQANVSETKASMTVSVGALPANGESVVIGSCVVAFVTAPGVTTDEKNCTDNAATIDTNEDDLDVDRTPAEIATVISELTNVSDSVHGSLDSSLHSTAVIFTTAGTETSATEIAFTDYTSGDITVTASTAGVLPVAQVSTITPANIETGDTFTVIINGTTISYTAAFNTVAVVTAGLTAAINASSQSTNVTATDQSTRIDVTSDAAGTAFTIAGGTANRTTTVAQVDAVTPANVELGDTFTVIINGLTISYTATADGTANATAGLTAAINSSAQASTVTATDHTVRLDITAVTSGVPFTITGGTINRPPVAQVSTVTPLTVKPEESVYVEVNGTKYYYVTSLGDTAANVITGLKAAITNSDVTVSGSDNITLTASVEGTAFTVAAGFSEVVLSSDYSVIRDSIKIGNLTGNLRIGDITTTQAKIIWTTDSPWDATLYVSKIKGKLKKKTIPKSVLTLTDSNWAIVHGFALSGLKKKAKHYFLVQSGESRSKIFTFKTLHPKKLVY